MNISPRVYKSLWKKSCGKLRGLGFVRAILSPCFGCKFFFHTSTRCWELVSWLLWQHSVLQTAFDTSEAQDQVFLPVSLELVRFTVERHLHLPPEHDPGSWQGSSQQSAQVCQILSYQILQGKWEGGGDFQILKHFCGTGLLRTSGHCCYNNYMLRREKKSYVN